MDYLTVPAGGFKFRAYDPGDSANANAIASQFQTLSLAPSTQNTFVYLGGGTNQYLFLDDGTPAAGSAMLRVANTDGQYPTLKAWVNSNGSTTGNPTISGVTAGTASGYVTLPPGPYILTLVLPFLVSGEAALPVPITLVANQNVTVYLFATDLLGDGTLILADN